jgi:hypothetical protein
MKAVASRLGQTSTRLMDTFYVEVYLEASREVAGLRTAVEELDLERPVVNRTLLPDQLVHPLFLKQARAVLVDVRPARGRVPRRLLRPWSAAEGSRPFLQGEGPARVGPCGKHPLRAAGLRSHR